MCVRSSSGSCERALAARGQAWVSRSLSIDAKNGIQQKRHGREYEASGEIGPILRRLACLFGRHERQFCCIPASVLPFFPDLPRDGGNAIVVRHEGQLVEEEGKGKDE